MSGIIEKLESWGGSVVDAIKQVPHLGYVTIAGVGHAVGDSVVYASDVTGQVEMNLAKPLTATLSGVGGAVNSFLTPVYIIGGSLLVYVVYQVGKTLRDDNGSRVAEQGLMLAGRRYGR